MCSPGELTYYGSTLPSYFPIGSATTLNLPNATRLLPRALYGSAWLQSIRAPKLSHVGEEALMFCTRFRLSSMAKTVVELGESACAYAGVPTDHVVLSACQIIGPYAFRGSKLSSISAPRLVQAGLGTFAACTATSISAPLLRVVPVSFAERCYSLGRVTIMAAKVLSGRAFFQCHNLAVVRAQWVHAILHRCFAGCARLRRIRHWRLRLLGSEAFRDSGIAVFSANQVEVLGPWAFRGCSSLVRVTASRCKTVRRGCFQDSGVAFVYAPHVSLVEEFAFFRAHGGAAMNLGTGKGLLTIECSAFAEAHIQEVASMKNAALGPRAFAGATVHSLRLPHTVRVGPQCFAEATLVRPVVWVLQVRIAPAAFCRAQFASVTATCATHVGRGAFKHARGGVVAVGCLVAEQHLLMGSTLTTVLLHNARVARHQAFWGADIGVLHCGALERYHPSAFQHYFPVVYSGGVRKFPCLGSARKPMLVVLLCLRRQTDCNDACVEILSHVNAAVFM